MRFVKDGAVPRTLIVLAALLIARPGAAAGQESADPQVRQGIDAYLVGDLTGAEAALRAVPADAPREDRSVTQFYLGLIAFARDDRSGARASFGRALDEMPSLQPDPALHSPSRLALFEEVRTERIGTWRERAQRAEQTGNTAEAVDRWTAILAASPADPEARAAVTRLAGAPPEAAPAREESARTTPPSTLGSSTRRSPAAAAGLGLLIPGGGEFYVGRPGRGLVVLAGAAGAVATGLLITRVEVDCLSVPVNDQCPPEDILSETETRPYLTASLVTAGAIMVLGAIDAAVGANRGLTRLGSRLDVGPDGAVRVTLARWRP